MTYIIRTDTGGTFTDGSVARESRRLVAAKSPSTPLDNSRRFLDVLDDLAKELGIKLQELLVQHQFTIHGTTSALNAVVTGSVTKVGSSPRAAAPT